MIGYKTDREEETVPATNERQQQPSGVRCQSGQATEIQTGIQQTGETVEQLKCLPTTHQMLHCKIYSYCVDHRQTCMTNNFCNTLNSQYTNQV